MGFQKTDKTKKKMYFNYKIMQNNSGALYLTFELTTELITIETINVPIKYRHSLKYISSR